MVEEIRIQDKKAYNTAIGCLRNLYDSRQRIDFKPKWVGECIGPNMKVYPEIRAPRLYNWEYEIMSMIEISSLRALLRRNPLYTIYALYKGKCLVFDMRVPKKITQISFERLVARRVLKEYRKWENEMEEMRGLFKSWISIPFRGLV